jgi:hypothetical protein
MIGKRDIAGRRGRAFLVYLTPVATVLTPQEVKELFQILKQPDEILNLADRIAVIYEGDIMGAVKREDASVEDLGLMMAGVHPSENE